MKRIAAVIFLAVALRAQDAASPAPLVVAGFLGLSQDQASQFQTMLQNLQAAVGPLSRQAALAQQDLDKALSDPQPDAATVLARLLAVRTVQRQIAAALDSYHSAFNALLTAEQRQKVQAVNQARDLLPAVAAFAQTQLIAPPH
jgi:uncharacterized membrane protein